MSQERGIQGDTNGRSSYIKSKGGYTGAGGVSPLLPLLLYTPVLGSSKCRSLGHQTPGFAPRVGTNQDPAAGGGFWVAITSWWSQHAGCCMTGPSLHLSVGVLGAIRPLPPCVMGSGLNAWPGVSLDPPQPWSRSLPALPQLVWCASGWSHRG